MRKWAVIFKTAFSQWRDDKASRLAAAIAYYVVFAIAPLLVLVIALAGLVFGKEAAEGQIAGLLSNYVGDQVAAMLQGAAASARRPGAGVTASVIGFGVLLVGTFKLLREMKSALDTVWGVTLKKNVPWTTTVRRYVGPFLLIPLLGALLMVLIAGTAILEAVRQHMGGTFTELAYLVDTAYLIVSFAIVVLLFAIIYKTLPDVTIAWSDVFIGASITAFLFLVGEFLLGLYLHKKGMGSIYGAAGSLVVFLAWVYYSAQIVLFGAELTEAYSKQMGRKMKPKEETGTLIETIKRQVGKYRSG